MKVITLKKEKILKTAMVITFAILICGFSTSFGMQHYYKLDFVTGLVTATNLNVRSGPGTQYQIVTTVKKGEYIRVFAGVGDWYIVQVEGDFVGAVSKKYVKPIYPSSTNTNNNQNNQNNQNTTSSMSNDEKEVFNLINQQRNNNGINSLKIDEEVQRVAKIKAQDMVNNNYFSHESPTYGTPFNMLSNFKISYKTAGENIAANSSNSGAVTAWMNSSGHKANILNSNFTHTGIGVVSSQKYGKIFVQMFIGK
jgi:uncharacterized YkwD family protein